MKILIVNTLGIQVVSSIRSLSSLGHEVFLAIPVDNKNRKKGLGRFFYPKGAKNVQYISSPNSIKEFESDILDMVSNGQYDVILPFGFETTVGLSLIKDTIVQYVQTSVADYDLIQKVHDKENLNYLLSQNGFVVPAIYRYNYFDDFANIEVKYPVVIKARKGCGIDKGVRYANNYKDLKKYYNEISENNSKNLDLSDFTSPLIQEYIPGKIYDGCFVCNNGEVIASLLQVRDVTYPLSGGVGVNIVTIEDNELLNYCTEILKFLKWHGPCQVEVKKDSRDGQYKLIEINPKLWGTLGLSIYAGIDFSLKACELAMGKLQKQENYKLGLKYKILFPLEIYTIYQDKGNRFRRILKLLEVFKLNVKTEFSLTDIKPNIWNIINTVYILLCKRNTILPKGKEFYEKS